MLKTILAGTAAVALLAAAPALTQPAQTPAAPTTTAPTPPAATAPTTPLAPTTATTDAPMTPATTGAVTPSATTTPPAAPADAGAATTTTVTVTPEEADPEFVEFFEEGAIRASEIIGTAVVNLEGEELGDVTDIVVDEDGIRILVIGVGGFLGLGERDVGVAYDRVMQSRDDGGNLVLTLDATRDALEDAPEFQGQRPADQAPETTTTTTTAPVTTTTTTPGATTAPAATPPPAFAPTPQEGLPAENPLAAEPTQGPPDNNGTAANPPLGAGTQGTGATTEGAPTPPNAPAAL